PGTVFLATRMGLFCSPDRGKSWQEMEIWRFSPLAYARDIQVAPHDPNTLYAALSSAALGKNGSLYRSQDLGQTWRRFDHGVTVKKVKGDTINGCSLDKAERISYRHRKGLRGPDEQSAHSTPRAH